MPISVRRIALLVVGAVSCSQLQAAQPRACAQDAANSPPAASLRLDNDVFGDQDQGYSNGIELRLVSAGVTDHGGSQGLEGGGGCRWPVTDWLARQLRFLAPAGAGHENLTFSFGQAIFTPVNGRRTELIPDDRPYAAALLLGLGFNARRGERLQTTLLQAGIVGPSARGQQAQDAIHKLTGDDPFLGWANQLRDEGVFRLVHERLRRHELAATSPDANAWRQDAISHWGVSAGNLLTHVNLGGELRWGPTLPDDFGSNPARPSGERSLGARGDGRGGFGPDLTGHGFVAFDARWVLWDVSLDGNAFKDSHDVDKRPFVVDFSYGLVLARGPWKLAIARVHRSREFRGQRELPVFGSISISRSF